MAVYEREVRARVVIPVRLGAPVEVVHIVARGPVVLETRCVIADVNDLGRPGTLSKGPPPRVSSLRVSS